MFLLTRSTDFIWVFLVSVIFSLVISFLVSFLVSVSVLIGFLTYKYYPLLFSSLYPPPTTFLSSTLVIV